MNRYLAATAVLTGIGVGSALLQQVSVSFAQSDAPALDIGGGVAGGTDDTPLLEDFPGPASGGNGSAESAADAPLLDDFPGAGAEEAAANNTAAGDAPPPDDPSGTAAPDPAPVALDPAETGQDETAALEDFEPPPLDVLPGAATDDPASRQPTDDGGDDSLAQDDAPLPDDFPAPAEDDGATGLASLPEDDAPDLDGDTGFEDPLAQSTADEAGDDLEQDSVASADGEGDGTNAESSDAPPLDIGPDDGLAALEGGDEDEGAMGDFADPLIDASATVQAGDATAEAIPDAVDRSAPAAARKSGWLSSLSIDAEIVAYQEETGVEDRARNNPGNAVFRIPESRSVIEMRPEIRFSRGPVRAELSPRLGWRRARTTVNGKRLSDTKWDARIAYGRVAYEKGGLSAQAGRYVNEWGPSVFNSPSNPFHRRSGAIGPYIELEGRDYAEVAYAPPGTPWSGRLIYNFGTGDQPDDPDVPIVVGKLGWFGSKVTVTGVGQYSDERVALGGYGQWTPNDAVVIYGDAIARYGEPRLARPGRSAFRRGEDEFSATLLVGGSYSFEDGTTLALEYLHNTDGYDSDDADAVYALANSALHPRSRVDQGAIGTLANVPFFDLRRNYLMARLTRQNLFDQLDVGALYAHNVDDQSGRFTTNLDWYLNDKTILFLNGTLFHGGDDTEFGRFADHQVAVGLRYRPF